MLSIKKSQFKFQSCNCIDHQPNKGRCQRPNNALHKSTYYRIHGFKTKKAGIGSGLTLPIPAINYWSAILRRGSTACLPWKAWQWFLSWQILPVLSWPESAHIGAVCRSGSRWWSADNQKYPVPQPFSVLLPAFLFEAQTAFFGPPARHWFSVQWLILLKRAA